MTYPDNLTGFAFIQKWRAIDAGTSVATYDWSVTDLYANAIGDGTPRGGTVGKKKQWLWWFDPFRFVSGTPRSCSTGFRCCPDWLVNQGLFQCQGNYRTLGQGVYPKMYNTPVFNAITGLIDAFIARYDSDPYCEGIVFAIGSAMPVLNAVDTLGTSAPNINYDTDYTDSGMLTSYLNLITHVRSKTTNLNFWVNTDYLFNEGGSSSWTGQDVQWAQLIQALINSQGGMGGPDSWTQNWVYPNAITSAGSGSGTTGCLTPAGASNYAITQNSYSPANSCYHRAIYADEVYRGWRAASPGGSGFVGQIRKFSCIELTEMGGSIGQFAPSDVWLARGTATDKSQYMAIDINYSQTGNFNTGTSGSPKPNTYWNTIPSGQSGTVTGPTVYSWIQTAGATNTVDPYGKLVNGQPFTVRGSGFGSKTNNTLIWDPCTGSNLSVLWSGFFSGATQTFPTAYRTPAQTPYGVGVPTPQNTKMICGVHNATTASDALDVGFYTYRNFVANSYSVWDYDSRLNPSWTFNLNPGPNGPDNNFKSYGIAGGHDNIYGDDYGNGTAGHVYDGATPGDLNALNASWGLGYNDDSGGGFTNMYGTKSNQYGWWDNTNKTIFSAWSKWTRVTKWTATNGQGYQTVQVDYGRIANWFRTPTSGGGTGIIGSGGSGPQTFYTDALNDSTGILRTEGLGGYTRNYPAITNWRYWCNIYHDFGLNPGRFYLMNGATIAASTIIQIQPWIANQWSDTQTNLIAFQGNLPSGVPLTCIFVTEITGTVVITTIQGNFRF